MTTYNAHETERMRQVHGVQLATFTARLVAITIDFVLCGVLFLLLVVVGTGTLVGLGWLDAQAEINLEFDFRHWYSLLFIVIYFGVSTYLGKGQTVGKRVVGIRVVSLVHERLSLWHSFERALGYGASVLEFGFGFFQYFVHPNRRTVHDRIAETIVMVDYRSGQAPQGVG